MKLSPNLGLQLPEKKDKIDIDIISENFSKLDKVIENLNQIGDVRQFVFPPQSNWWKLDGTVRYKTESPVLYEMFGRPIAPWSRLTPILKVNMSVSSSSSFSNEYKTTLKVGDKYYVYTKNQVSIADTPNGTYKANTIVVNGSPLNSSTNYGDWGTPPFYNEADSKFYAFIEYYFCESTDGINFTRIKYNGYTSNIFICHLGYVVDGTLLNFRGESTGKSVTIPVNNYLTYSKENKKFYLRNEVNGFRVKISSDFDTWEEHVIFSSTPSQGSHVFKQYGFNPCGFNKLSVGYYMYYSYGESYYTFVYIYDTETRTGKYIINKLDNKSYSSLFSAKPEFLTKDDVYLSNKVYSLVSDQVYDVPDTTPPSLTPLQTIYDSTQSALGFICARLTGSTLSVYWSPFDTRERYALPVFADNTYIKAN